MLVIYLQRPFIPLKVFLLSLSSSCFVLTDVDGTGYEYGHVLLLNA